jgi:hypothetical protein
MQATPTIPHWRRKQSGPIATRHSLLHTPEAFKLREFFMIRIRHLACILLLISPALAADDQPLEGSTYLDAEGCAKGLKSETCVLSFYIKGKTAKLLYDELPGKGILAECTGGMEKNDDHGLHCSKFEDGTFTCDFGYSFKEKKFIGSAEDC